MTDLHLFSLLAHKWMKDNCVSEDRNNTESRQYNGGTQSKAKAILQTEIIEIMQIYHIKIIIKNSEMLFGKCRKKCIFTG